ncbi:Uncharacterized protein TCAP_05020 [Tolypocladium capitatum]|uniref:SWIM-type domain-containing protein n=1 Tax=Tolypocladium capitatum TaxID=45235 RepID=A0A2K3QBZ5_9HYPO|nr:Uncharacterized protein TCAP_05020 [Tolypocladium capitatum]
MTQSLLPSHRQLLTRLVASLSQSPPTSTSTPQANALAPDGGAAGPADADRRHLLLTLHVLFPSVVLPALDLLDRRLVTRITVAGERPGPDGPPRTGFTHARGHNDDGDDDDDDAGHLVEDGGGDGDGGARAGQPTSSQHTGVDEAPFIRVYTVRSLASTLTRRSRRDAASASKTYVVYLDAWSCSCASFALEAFTRHAQPAVKADAAAPSSPLAPDNDTRPGLSSFGGMGADGLPGHGGDVPCCKHLMACLLAEKWGDVLESRVDDKRATKEELAGIISNV